MRNPSQTNIVYASVIVTVSIALILLSSCTRESAKTTEPREPDKTTEPQEPAAQQFQKLAPFTPVPVPIPNNDFTMEPTASEILPGWHYEGPARTPEGLLDSDDARGTFFSPRLRRGEACVLRTAAPITLKKHHHYCLEMDVRGAPYTTWKVSLLVDNDARAPATRALLSGLPPPPLWERRRFYFTATTPFTAPRLSFAYELQGENRGLQPGLDAIRLTDLGPVAFPVEPGRNLKINPGLEQESGPGAATLGWHGGSVVLDPESAYSGKRFYRIPVRHRNIIKGIVSDHVTTPCLITVTVWARGEGCRLSFFLDQYAPGYVRLTSPLSSEMTLDGTWQKHEWEFSVYQRTDNWNLTLDLRGDGTVDLDDMEVVAVPIQLPPRIDKP